MSNPKLCTVEGCSRKHRAKGMCTTHRYRFDNGLPMDAPVRQYETGERICKVDGCERERTAGGDGDHCPMHRRRLDRGNDVGEAAPQRAPFNEAVWNQPDNRRRYALLENYGLTVEQYDAMLLRQNYRCAICRTDRPESSRATSERSFCIDHDHDTGAVRGLLCHACNRGIGMLKDDLDVVLAAAEYLRQHRPAPARPVAELVDESIEILRDHAHGLLVDD